MKQLLLLAASLLLVNTASAADSATCNAEFSGKNSCVAGETMKCIRLFSTTDQKTTYEWHGVNSSGQAFKTNIPLYKKVPGFTPRPCTSETSPDL